MPRARRNLASTAAIALVCLAAAWAANLHTSHRAAATDAAKPAASPEPGALRPEPNIATQRLREGATLVDEPGTFVADGERLSFVPSKAPARFIVLENLNLERIAHALADSQDERLWSVSGTVTEYRGGNYLLITRATLKARPRSRGAP